MKILGANIDNINFIEALEKVSVFLDSEKTNYIVTPNPEIILASQKDAELMDILNNADLAIPDGVGLVLASVFKIRHRVAGADLMQAILKKHKNKKYKFVVRHDGLSAREEIIEKAKVKIDEENPDIIFVGLGFPEQEKWIKHNKDKYPSARVILAVGGAFDFLTGKQRRAPVFLRKIGLEWLWRLYLQPKRYKRIFNATFKFLFSVFISKFKLRFVHILIFGVIILVGLNIGCRRNEEEEKKAFSANKTYDGATLFADTHNPGEPKIIEINMDKEIVWEYIVPPSLVKGQIVGLDAESLSNGNILLVLSQSGVYEIDRDGSIVWSYSDAEVSHDADRLPNGNTLVIFGNNDQKTDAQVKEVNPAGEIVWQWHAKDVYGNDPRFRDIKMQGWTHTNAAQRLADGTTMINLRNFYLTVIVDSLGKVVKEFDWSKFGSDVDPHEPEIHENEGTLLVCLQNDAQYVLVEIDMNTEEVVWTYENPRLRTTRDGDKLPNGNVLLVAVDNNGTSNSMNMEDDTSTIIEVAPDGEIVWRHDLENAPVGRAPGWFYKAERVGY